jgi:putative nucleotidyltransferase with HDIG domain
MMPTRDDAWKLLSEYVKSESLVKHCLAVEAAMRAYARKFGEDEELWGLCGLLHDFDYEKYPTPDAAARTGHPFEGEKILREKGYSEEVIKKKGGLHRSQSGIQVFDVNNALIFLAKSSFRWLNRYSISFRYQ